VLITAFENTDMFTFLCKLYTYVNLRGICDRIGGSTINGFAIRFLLDAVDTRTRFALPAKSRDFAYLRATSRLAKDLRQGGLHFQFGRIINVTSISSF